MTYRLRSVLLVQLCFGLLLAPLCTVAEHHGTWIEIQSPHFTVLSNAGESEGRNAALHFEEIRALFQHLYPDLRVDSGKPTIIFAIKNEDSLKLFIPSYGQNSKAMRIGGFYSRSYDKDFAVTRTDVRDTGPLGFRNVYFEYTQAFFHYNFRGLPLWLDVGLGEYYGNTDIENEEASVGMANEDELRLLKEATLLPIDQLVTIDRTSPLYNTAEHSGIFYAESWALVHYLNNSAGVRDQDLINKYLHTLHATDDPIQAASQSFGDLKKFSASLEGYIHRLGFEYHRVSLQSRLPEKDFTVRTLSPAEGIVAQADFLLRNGHLPEGLERLHEVERLDPATPGYHSEFAHYHLLKADYANAEKELQLAMAANPNDISAHIDMAYVYLRRDGYTKDSTPKIRAELEKVLSLSPDFAPAHAFLSIAYAHDPDKDTDKALKSALRASELQPGNLAYFIDIGKAYLAAGRISEAGKIAETGQKLATTSNDRNMAISFTKQIDYKVNHPQETASAPSTDEDLPAHDATVADSAEGPAHAEGQITELLCGHAPEVLLTLTTGSNSLLLHVSDIAKISIQADAKASDATELPCSKWKDRHATVDYRAMSSGMAQGEVLTISLE
jgi:tetratricopeptide (TPR) repeat protein